MSQAKALIEAGDRYERARFVVEDIMEKGGVRSPASSGLLVALRERSVAKAEYERIVKAAKKMVDPDLGLCHN